jgi:hypothetical protein
MANHGKITGVRFDGLRVLVRYLRFLRALHAKLESAGCKQVGFLLEGVREGM